MEEFVGTCTYCGKDIYCKDGFLNGVLDEEQMVLCYDCAEE